MASGTDGTRLPESTAVAPNGGTVGFSLCGCGIHVHAMFTMYETILRPRLPTGGSGKTSDGRVALGSFLCGFGGCL